MDEWLYEDVEKTNGFLEGKLMASVWFYSLRLMWKAISYH